jgi:hypothetical protein
MSPRPIECQCPACTFGGYTPGTECVSCTFYESPDHVHLRAVGRNPNRALRELARLADPRDPRDAILELYAAHGPTRNPFEALLSLHAVRIMADDF